MYIRIFFMNLNLKFYFTAFKIFQECIKKILKVFYEKKHKNTEKTE
jgi:hypothetical protein